MHKFTLVICFYHHGDHVKTDEDHNADVKCLFCYNIKHQTLQFILRGEKRKRDTSLYVMNTLCFPVFFFLTQNILKNLKVLFSHFSRFLFPPQNPTHSYFLRSSDSVFPQAKQLWEYFPKGWTNFSLEWRISIEPRPF